MGSSNQDNDDDDSHSKKRTKKKRRSQKKCLLHMGEIAPVCFFKFLTVWLLICQR